VDTFILIDSCFFAQTGIREVLSYADNLPNQNMAEMGMVLFTMSSSASG
jgi:hypothetical protein